MRSVAVYTAFLVLLLVLVEVAERFLVSRGWDLGVLKPPEDSAKSYSSGVFLAVYFTAVSVAASAIYAEVPHEVRMLLARDRLGRFFLQFIAACTAVALLLLGYRGLGGTTGKGVLALSVFFGCYSIFAVLVVLRSSVTLFDPAKVGHVIFRDLAQAVRSASIRGFAWRNRNFQTSYSNQAASSLQTLGMVVEICTKKSGLGNRPLSDLMISTLDAWAVYAHYRAWIPFESEWYRSD